MTLGPAGQLELALEYLHDALLTGDRDLIMIAESNLDKARIIYHAWAVENVRAEGYYKNV